MKLTQHFLTGNDCYKIGRTIRPKGIMVHSLGVAQPNVQVFLDTWNAGGVTKCVHAFVAKDGVYQTLPWNRRGWHAGGAANNTHIGFEICEPAGHTYSGGTMIGYDAAGNAEYFKAVWKNAVELCAMLCGKYGFDPATDIICHCEGHKRGIASNHADVMHWFPRHGESMDTFRAAVRKEMEDDMAKYIEQIASKAGVSAETVVTNLAALVKQANVTEDSWEKEGLKALKDMGLINSSRPANAPVAFGELGLILGRFRDILSK